MEVTLFPGATDIEITDRLTPPPCGVFYGAPGMARSALAGAVPVTVVVAG